jgi:hypothetical protein
MSTRSAVVWRIRVAAAGGLTGFGIYLLVLAWGAPFDDGGALFTPVAFMGALLCFGSAIACVVPRHALPRNGRPAAR